MGRRGFLKGAALGGAGLVLGGGGWRAHQAGLIVPDDTAFAPWSALAGARPGDPAGLAAAAILASTPHNTQPWRIGRGDGILVVAADTERHLGAFDPYRREMWIGLGAAVANAEVAAGGLGFATDEPRVFDLGAAGAGRVELPFASAAAAPHPLADALPRRRTNRGPYEAGDVPGGVMERIAALAGRVDGARLTFLSRVSRPGAAFAEGTVRATGAIVADAPMSHDGHVWYRANARAVARYRDGVSIPTAGLSSLMSTLGQMLPAPDAATSGRYWLASTRDQVAGAAGFGLIVVDDLHSRRGQVAAGRLWQRLHLAMTLEGLAAQPMNQLPELVDRDRQLGRDRGWQALLRSISGGEGAVTFAFRFGRPLRQVPHSARRPLEWVSA
jgi:hypothetical protein